MSAGEAWEAALFIARLFIENLLTSRSKIGVTVQGVLLDNVSFANQHSTVLYLPNKADYEYRDLYFNFGISFYSR